MEREMKPFFAVALLTIAAVLMVNHIILAVPIAEWGLAGGIFVLGAFFAVWAMMPEANQETDLALGDTDAPANAQEWVIARDILPDGTPRIQVSEAEALPFDALAEGEK